MQTKIIALHQNPYRFRVPYDPRLNEALNKYLSNYPHNGISFRKRFSFIQINLNKKLLININPLLKNPQLNRPFKQRLLYAYERIRFIPATAYIYLNTDLNIYHANITACGCLFGIQNRQAEFNNSQTQLKKLNKTLEDIIDTLKDIREIFLVKKQHALAKQFQKNIYTIMDIRKIIDRLLIPSGSYNSKCLEKQARIILQKLTLLRFSAKYLKPFDFIQEILRTEISADLQIKYSSDIVSSRTHRPLSVPQAPSAAQDQLSLTEKSNTADTSIQNSDPVLAKQPETN